jgi:hypothetical protein
MQVIKGAAGGRRGRRGPQGGRKGAAGGRKGAASLYTYIHTKLYLNQASLNSRWKAGFHEGPEITYLQKVNYIQEIQNITK